ncbi:MAG TPA: hypothetical protein VJZ01_12340 [Lachnospiraceae bacterium]|nr:hypothetical protein [Lachnospiraceae bacterium]
MTQLLVLKERLIKFYARLEIYILPLLKFVTALIVLLIINGNLGYMYRLKNPAIVIMAALACSFLPSNMIIIVAAAYVILHLYALSLECAIVVLLVFVLMFVLYFRFSPKDSMAVLLTPICFALRIPYVMPLTMGFIGNPMSVVSVGSGTVVYYMLKYIKDNETQLGNLEADSAAANFKYVVDNIMNNKEMVLMAVAFGVTIVLVYLVKRLSIDHSWRIALGVGAISNIMVIFIGDLSLDIDANLGATILGSIVSVLFVIVLQFFVFNVDYSRTEYVQFEDDEYYYYVKAIPKISVTTPAVKVKRINPQRGNERRTMGDTD